MDNRFGLRRKPLIFWIKFIETIYIITCYISNQSRSQGPLSTSRKYPGCGWSCAYVYKSNPHRGWIFDLILSKLSVEVKVALLFLPWELSKWCFRDPAWPVLQSFLSKLLWVRDVDWKGSLFIFTTFSITVSSQLRVSVITFSKNKN